MHVNPSEYGDRNSEEEPSNGVSTHRRLARRSRPLLQPARFLNLARAKARGLVIYAALRFFIIASMRLDMSPPCRFPTGVVGQPVFTSLVEDVPLAPQ